MQKQYIAECEFTSLRSDPALTRCPHCGGSGTLILHGKLYGYGDSGPHGKVLRGQRIFCNNRRKHNKGCGHTFVIWAADKLKHACLGAHGLWRFLRGVVTLSNKAAALRTAGLDLSESSAYRLWKRFLKAQSGIRTMLHQICPPPALPHVRCPAIQTIFHLEAAFGSQACPIEAFQKRFQVSFN